MAILMLVINVVFGLIGITISALLLCFVMVLYPGLGNQPEREVISAIGFCSTPLFLLLLLASRGLSRNLGIVGGLVITFYWAVANMG